MTVELRKGDLIPQVYAANATWASNQAPRKVFVPKLGKPSLRTLAAQLPRVPRLQKKATWPLRLALTTSTFLLIRTA